MKAKYSLTKGKFIFIIDLLMLLVFPVLIFTGIKLHVYGSKGDHEIWSFWAHFHIIVSVVMLLIGILHVKAHWGWYKGLMRGVMRKKSKVIIALSVLFVILTITGILLVMFEKGGNSPLGLWHYRFGLAIIVAVVLHTIARFTLLKKGLLKMRTKASIR